MNLKNGLERNQCPPWPGVTHLHKVRVKHHVTPAGDSESFFSHRIIYLLNNFQGFFVSFDW